MYMYMYAGTAVNVALSYNAIMYPISRLAEVSIIVISVLEV
jgi:hypothetical protein